METESAAVAEQHYPPTRARLGLVLTVLGRGSCHVCIWGHYIIKYTVIPCQITFEPLLILPRGLLRSLLIEREMPAFGAFLSLAAAAARCPAATPITHHPVHLQKHQGDQLVLRASDGSARKVKVRRRSVKPLTADLMRLADEPSAEDVTGVTSLSCVSVFDRC